MSQKYWYWYNNFARNDRVNDRVASLIAGRRFLLLLFLPEEDECCMFWGFVGLVYFLNSNWKLKSHWFCFFFAHEPPHFPPVAAVSALTSTVTGGRNPLSDRTVSNNWPALASTCILACKGFFFFARLLTTKTRPLFLQLAASAARRDFLMWISENIVFAAMSLSFSSSVVRLCVCVLSLVYVIA